MRLIPSYPSLGQCAAYISLSSNDLSCLVTSEFLHVITLHYSQYHYNLVPQPEQTETQCLDNNWHSLVNGLSPAGLL